MPGGAGGIPGGAGGIPGGAGGIPGGAGGIPGGSGGAFVSSSLIIKPPIRNSATVSPFMHSV